MAREEGGRGREHKHEERATAFVDRLVHINRVAKVARRWFYHERTGKSVSLLLPA